MAETFSTVSASSFKNYAFSFGKVLISQRCKTVAAVPLNLLSVPFWIGYGALGMFTVASHCWGRRESLGVATTTTTSTVAATVASTRKSVAGMCGLKREATKVLDATREMTRGVSDATREMTRGVSRPVDAMKSWGRNISSNIEEKLALELDLRDPAVVVKIDEIRLAVLSNEGKKLHFERAIARFCRVQVRTDGMVVGAKQTALAAWQCYAPC